MQSLIARRPPSAFFNCRTDRFTQPFWDAAAVWRLTVPRCVRCGTLRMPPTPFCPQCRCQEVDWVALSGQGFVYSYTVVTRAILPDMEDCLPYVPAVIELAGANGCRLISNVVDVSLDAITVDLAVRVVWDDVNGITVPRFTPA